MDLVQYVQESAPAGASIDHDYLRRISSMPQDRLESEKARVDASIAEVTESEHALGARHLADFVDAKPTMQSVADLMQALSQLSTEAVEVSLAVPRPPERAYTALRGLLADRLAVYAQIDRIQELASLPVLVKDSILKGDYGTALDIADMMQRLQKRYPASTLIDNLVTEVQTSVESMREILLRSLREGTRLPLLLKAVSFLRRVSPEQPDAVFVESRWHFLQAQWEHLPSQLHRTQPFTYLKRVVEIYREHVFATINGFYTIFAQDGAGPGEDSPVLSIFVRRALNRLLEVLRETAPRISDPNDRASLWLQLAFCSQSLGRVGAGFWPLLDTDILSVQEWEEAARHQQDMARRAGRVTVSK